MIDTEYLTQILFKSARHEESVVFFRRVQKKIWSMLPKYYPEIDSSGVGILDALSFDEFSRKRSFQMGLDSVNCVSGRNLETAKLCSQAITISLAGESAHVKGQSDNTYKTDICIESAKVDSSKPAIVRFSYTTRILYQPFAGFYPLATKKYETPEFVKELLALPDLKALFMPRIDLIQGSNPKFAYPLTNRVVYVDDEKKADEFVKLLNDRARPIPFLVFMGESKRMVREAEFFMPLVYSKAWVFIINRADLIKGKIEPIVEGIDLKRDFRNKACRLFFPFGSWSCCDFANPSYSVGFFGRDKYRALVLNGMLRFFDLDEPGWRRSQRDVHMVQLDLQAERKLAAKAVELNDSKGAVTKMQEIVNLVLEERKHEKDEIEKERKKLNEDRELFEGENKQLEEEKQSLLNSNSELMGQVEALKQQLKDWQGSDSRRDFKFGIDSCYPNEVYDHIVEMLKMIDGHIPAEYRRRRQIYEAVMKANPTSGELQRRKDGVAAIVRNKNEISPSDIKAFERLGFAYSKDGPHHKFSMGSFCMTMACTGSDKGRGWKNSIRDFNRTFFYPLCGED